MPEEKFRAVIFDIDGTLVDSYAAHYKSWRLMAERYDYDFTDEMFSEIFGSLNKDFLPKILGERSTPELVDEIDKETERTFREIIEKEFPAMPGAAELVRRCHEEGYRIAVGSSAPRENVEISIRGLGIAPFLSAVVCQEDVERVKPDPAIFLSAARQMGIAPEQCVVIDDSVYGIKAAKAAGMFCIGFRSRGHRPEEYTLADRVVRSLFELDPVFLRNETGGASVADRAVSYYSQKTKGLTAFNCAQAVSKAFGRDDLVEAMATCGGGRAPEGLCGALYAAMTMLSDEKKEALKQDFHRGAGDILCRSIRRGGGVSCPGCVRIAAELLSRYRSLPSMPATASLRLARPDDAPLVLRFIRELAEYEKLSDRVKVVPETLRDWISRGKIEVLFAETEGDVAGFAIYYFTISTFPGVECLYLEDLFVRPEFRHRGIGRRLFEELIDRARAKNCARMEWQVLDWNADGMAFYEQFGAKTLEDWKVYRLEM